MLPAQLATDPAFSERFRREANAAAGLNNPHVIPIHNFGEIDGRLYVDMRLVEGRDLQHILEQGPLDPSRAVGIIEQVASALDAAHRIGLVHRDVKPSNVLVDSEDFAYLIDFGIVRTVGDAGLTDTNKVVGTSAYMAPERIIAGPLDHRCDVYALACMLHECLTGQPPFPADSLGRQIAAHLTRPPPKPSQLRAGVPKQFDGVIAAGMAKDPEQRYATTKELAHAARNALTAPAAATRAGPVSVASAPPTVEATVANPRWWRRKAVIVPAAVLGVVIAVIASVIAITSGEGPSGIRYGAQVELPFDQLETLNAVAVDSTGTVFVADGSLVLKLTVGASAPTQLRVSVVQALGVAVNAGGDVYVLDQNNVLKFLAGTADRPVRYPYVDNPAALAVDTTGTVYVTDLATNNVFEYQAGAATSVELPFTDVTPCGVAVDSARTVYVVDHIPQSGAQACCWRHRSNRTALPGLSSSAPWRSMPPAPSTSLAAAGCSSLLLAPALQPNCPSLTSFSPTRWPSTPSATCTSPTPAICEC